MRFPLLPSQILDYCKLCKSRIQFVPLPNYEAARSATAQHRQFYILIQERKVNKNILCFTNNSLNLIFKQSPYESKG